MSSLRLKSYALIAYNRQNIEHAASHKSLQTASSTSLIQHLPADQC